MPLNISQIQPSPTAPASMLSYFECRPNTQVWNMHWIVVNLAGVTTSPSTYQVPRAPPITQLNLVPFKSQRHILQGQMKRTTITEEGDGNMLAMLRVGPLDTPGYSTILQGLTG